MNSFAGPVVSSASASANTLAAAAAPSPSGAVLDADAIRLTYVRSDLGTPAAIMSLSRAEARADLLDATHAAMSVL